MFNITRDIFEKESYALISCLSHPGTQTTSSQLKHRHQEQEQQDVPNDTSQTTDNVTKNHYSKLDRWTIETTRQNITAPKTERPRYLKHNIHNEIYLAHQPIIRRYHKHCFIETQTTPTDDATTTKAENSNNADEYDDDDDYGYDHNDYNDCDTATVESTDNFNDYYHIEWLFSVCYSDTWSVPVLYFRAQHLDGRICRRGEVVEALLRSRSITCKDNDVSSSGVVARDDDDDDDDRWEFISEEEHPVTGEPCYFLHPCQTSARLSLLLMNDNDDNNGIDRSGGSRTLCSNGNNDAMSHVRNHHDHHHPPGHLLLSWLSMILPALGFKIDAMHFLQWSKKLKELSS